jgi:sigma-B regulation protein RsbU (phosphoserine phosphatase)
MFVTIFCGMYDCTTHQLQYCNAGHNPPYILTADKKCALLPEKCGMALGVMPGAPFTTKSVHLQTGDTLLVYTDGFTEAQDAHGKMLGEDDAGKLLALYGTGDVKNLIDQILASINKYQKGVRQYDDITLLALRVLE